MTEKIKQEAKEFCLKIRNDDGEIWYGLEDIEPMLIHFATESTKELQEQSEKLQKELEAERKLNAEIKARFVKCNTCTDEMKDMCLMFSENLCGGERCEELVDLMSLVSKSDSETKVTKAKEIIREFMRITEMIEGFEPDYTELINNAETFLRKE